MRTTQKGAVLKLFKQGRKLNWLNTFELTGCSSVGRRVADFRKAGYVIDGTRVKFKTRFGTTGSYMNYKLNKEKTPKHLLK